MPIEKYNEEVDITKKAKTILTIISQLYITNLSNFAKQLAIKYKKRVRRANNQTIASK